MKGSLQEQLLKAGLVSEDQLEKARSRKTPGPGRKNKGRKGPTKGKGSAKGKHRGHKPDQHKSGDGGEPSLAEAFAQRDRLERSEKDRARAAQLAEERRRREVNKALDELLEGRRLNEADADIDRYFEWAGKIRKLYVTEDQQRRLNDGELGVVHHRGSFHLVATEVLEAVREQRAQSVAFFAPDLPDEVSGNDPESTQGDG